MKTLDFAKGLEIPLELVTQTIGLIARKGGGKTYAATKLAEEMLEAGAQVVAIDPVGVWWGLGLKADGQTPSGLPLYVFGGERGHLQLTADSGARVAKLLVERRISAVLDVSAFRQGERKRFAKDFAEEFFHLQKSSRKPVHIFVEEAQKFVPQQAGPDEKAMLGAFEDLVRLGRNYGIGVTLVSQRPQSVNKEALSQVEVLITLQVNGVHERKAVEAWVAEAGADRALVGELPGLKVGEAFFWSPAWMRTFKRITVKKKWTYDASRTPEVGEKAIEIGSLSPLEVDKLKHEWAEITAKAEADDARALQRRIRELERERAEERAAAGAQAAPDSQALSDALGQVAELQAEIQTAREKHQSDLRVLVGQVESAMEEGQAVVDRLRESAKYIRETELRVRDLVNARPPSAQRKGTTVVVRVPHPSRKTERAAPRPPSTSSNGTLKPAQIKILDAVRSATRGLTMREIAILVGHHHDGGSFRNTVYALHAAGYLEKISEGAEGYLYKCTAEGLAVFTDQAHRITADDVEQLWRRKLKPAQWKLFEAVRDHGPLSMEEIAEATGRSGDGGSFRNNVYAINAAGVFFKEAGKYRLSDTMAQGSP